MMVMTLEGCRVVVVVVVRTVAVRIWNHVEVRLQHMTSACWCRIVAEGMVSSAVRAEMSFRYLDGNNVTAQRTSSSPILPGG